MSTVAAAPTGVSCTKQDAGHHHDDHAYTNILGGTWSPCTLCIELVLYTASVQDHLPDNDIFMICYDK